MTTANSREDTSPAFSAARSTLSTSPDIPFKRLSIRRSKPCLPWLIASAVSERK